MNAVNIFIVHINKNFWIHHYLLTRNLQGEILVVNPNLDFMSNKAVIIYSNCVFWKMDYLPENPMNSRKVIEVLHNRKLGSITPHGWEVHCTNKSIVQNNILKLFIRTLVLNLLKNNVPKMNFYLWITLYLTVLSNVNCIATQIWSFNRIHSFTVV